MNRSWDKVFKPVRIFARPGLVATSWFLSPTPLRLADPSEGGEMVGCSLHLIISFRVLGLVTLYILCHSLVHPIRAVMHNSHGYCMDGPTGGVPRHQVKLNGPVDLAEFWVTPKFICQRVS